MTTKRRVAGILVLTGIVTTLMPLPAFAQRVQSNVVLVRADDVVEEDLYAAGNTIVVSGVVRGDLIAVAFDSIRIDGVVEGDVFAISTRIEVTGRIEGSLRVAGGTVVVDGTVGDDLFVGALTAQANSGSTVGRDVLVWSRTAELLGTVGRRIEGTQNRTRIGGNVGSGIDVTTSSLTLLPGLRVDGDVRYIADDAAVIADTVTIEGTFVRAEALAANLRVRGVRLLAQIVGALGALGLGIGILWSAPGRSLAAASALDRRPLGSLMWGVGLVSVPAALLIVTFGIVSLTPLSSSGPLVLVMLPMALAIASVVLIGLLAAPVPVGLAIGTRLRPEWSSYGRFVVGFPALVVAWLLPWVGGILSLLLAVAGLGSWLVADDPVDDPAD
jgi:cytoskeletal protein CcmA (bactofilin family)